MSYIERETVLKVLENSMEYSIKEFEEGEFRKGCIAAIKDDISNISHLPPADVQEVRHGYWLKKYNTYPRYLCTCCNYLFNNKGYKYCPECGAKMDGERKDENGK